MFRRGRESLLEPLDHLRGQGEAESEESSVELFTIDEAGVVAVEAEENAVPVLGVSG